MIKCDAYHNERNYLGGFGICYGTKEREPCSFGGDYNKCNLYSHGLKRNNKKEIINKLEDFTQVIKNCSGDCDNCDIYLMTYFEKYSGQKLVNLLNEAVNAIESLIQENSFLKLMQKQLTKDIPENELGKKVYNTLYH